MKIGEKEIVINQVYTRGIDKEFNKILFKWVWAVSVDWKTSLDISPDNIQEANDFLVKAMTNLTEEEVMQLPLDDYNSILEDINNIKNGKKSKVKSL